MNQLGLFLRKLRLEKNEVLFDMANKLHVSSAFLSAVENGRKSAPLAWIELISKEYNLDAQQREELYAGISVSIKQLRLDMGESSADKKGCALAFARTFNDLSDQDVQKIMDLLEKRRH